MTSKELYRQSIGKWTILKNKLVKLLKETSQNLYNKYSSFSATENWSVLETGHHLVDIYLDSNQDDEKFLNKLAGLLSFHNTRTGGQTRHGMQDNIKGKNYTTDINGQFKVLSEPVDYHEFDNDDKSKTAIIPNGIKQKPIKKVVSTDPNFDPKDPFKNIDPVQYSGKNKTDDEKENNRLLSNALLENNIKNLGFILEKIYSEEVLTNLIDLLHSKKGIDLTKNELMTTMINSFFAQNKATTHQSISSLVDLLEKLRICAVSTNQVDQLAYGLFEFESMSSNYRDRVRINQATNMNSYNKPIYFLKPNISVPKSTEKTDDVEKVIHTSEQRNELQRERKRRARISNTHKDFPIESMPVDTGSVYSTDSDNELGESVKRKKTVLINEDMAHTLQDEMKLTPDRFFSNVTDFLRNLLIDPSTAKPSLCLSVNGLDTTTLLRALRKNNIIFAKERLNDKDENGNLKTVTMTTSYQVPKEGYFDKVTNLFHELFECTGCSGAAGASTSGEFDAPAFGDRKSLIRRNGYMGSTSIEIANNNKNKKK